MDGIGRKYCAKSYLLINLLITHGFYGKGKPAQTCGVIDSPNLSCVVV